MFPKRGAIAALTTAAGLALLFSFKTPELAPGSGPLVADASSSDRSIATVVTTSDVTAAAGGPSPPDPEEAPSARPTPFEPPRPTHRSARQDTASRPDTAARSSVSKPPASASRTLTGSIVRTRFGDVQVAVVTGPGGISEVQTLRLPGPHFQSRRISQIVEPMLRHEALSAQSANIDWISGATYTSRAYAMSLQSALDQLG